MTSPFTIATDLAVNVVARPATAGTPGETLTVLYCVGDHASRAAIHRVTAKGAFTRECPRLADVPAVARTIRPAIVVVDVSGFPASDVIKILRETRRAAPSAHLIGVISYALSGGGEIVSMVRAGLDSMALRESGTLATEIDAAVRAAAGPRLLRRVAEELGLLDMLHDEAGRLVVAAVAAASWPNVAIAARTLGCSTRELQRRFADAQLGLPHDLLQLTRWILANAALRTTVLGQKPVAHALGFSTVGSMRDAVRRSLALHLDDMSGEEIKRVLWSRVVDEFGRRPAVSTR